MDEILEILREKEKELDKMVATAESFLTTAPKGRIRISTNHNTRQYLHQCDDKTETYISKKRTAFIQSLAQKDYAQKVLKQALKEQKLIQNFLEKYEPDGIIHVYDKLSLERKDIVKPYILPDKEFAMQWISAPYKHKDLDDNTENALITERGEKVRSKSEKILADKFNIMNIPYRYEEALNLKGYGTVYPDFTLLNVKKRKVYYWEHFGLMDQPEYCEKAIKKIEMMQRNGIFVGENLIVTYETAKHPLNMQTVEKLISKYLV